MPTFENYWDRLVSANPALKTDGVKVTLTIEQFKKRIQIAYDNGRDDGLKQFDSLLSGDTSSLFDIFRK